MRVNFPLPLLLVCSLPLSLHLCFFFPLLLFLLFTFAFFTAMTLHHATTHLLPHNFYLPTLALAFILGALCYKYLFSRRREDESMVSRRISKKAMESKKRKELYPKGYPNGWFKIMNSDELKIGQTKCITSFPPSLLSPLSSLLSPLSSLPPSPFPLPSFPLPFLLSFFFFSFPFFLFVNLLPWIDIEALGKDLAVSET